MGSKLGVGTPSVPHGIWEDLMFPREGGRSSKTNQLVGNAIDPRRHSGCGGSWRGGEYGSLCSTLDSPSWLPLRAQAQHLQSKPLLDPGPPLMFPPS